MVAKATADLSARRLVVAARGVRIDVDLAEGTLAVAGARGGPLLEGGRCAVELEDGRTITPDGGWLVERAPKRVEDRQGRGVRALLATEPSGGLRLLLEIAAYDAHPFALLRLGVEHAGRETLRVRRFVPIGAAGGLRLGATPARWRFFHHGWQSWSPTLSLSGAQRDVDARPPVLAPVAPPSGRGVFASEEVAALLDPATGRSLLLGFVSAHRQWTQVRLDAPRRAIEAAAFADGAALRLGETLWSERLLVEVTDAAPEALARYADALGREMGARVPAATPAGWCSWYYYFQQVTEADVLKNLRFLQEHRAALPVDYVQIDDGYQANIGDWTSVNEKFPHGMAWLADEIRSAGFRPGIWLAPFLVGAASRLFAEHPDWAVRDGDGALSVASRNWDQENYGLDTTHPSAEAWLRALFREVAEGWGYDYVKIDFLYGAAIAGRRHDVEVSRIEAYRRGLRAVRESVGERFVLGCGALMGASAGLVDGQRIGPDVAPWWRWARQPERGPGRPRAGGEPAADAAMRNTLTRGWMHRRLWANDPDCLLARTTRTKLTEPEVQSLATAIGLSGGMVLVSDDLTELPRDRLALISLLLPPLGDAPQVRDLLTAGEPSEVELAVARPFESWLLLGVFNWQRRRRTLDVRLPAGRWHAFELWERRYYGERAGAIELPDVPPHGARLLALRRPQPRPQFLGTTFHVSMGGREVASARYDGRRDVLAIGLRPVAKREGELFAHVPAGYRFVEAQLAGAPVAAERRGRRVLGLRFVLEEPAVLSVRFARGR